MFRIRYCVLLKVERTNAGSEGVPSYHREDGTYDTIGLTCDTVVLTAT